MGRLTLTISFIICSLLAAAQDSLPVKLQRELRGGFLDFTADLQGNIYLLTDAGGIIKLDKDYDSVAVYNELRRYGKLHSIDAGNPFRVLVYFKNSATVVVLDRLLNSRQVVDLRKLNMAQVSSVRLSYDNQIWLYDAQAARIRKMDDQGRLLMESADLRNVFPELPEFETIIDADRRLYLYDSARGWYMFDYYGGYAGRVNYPGWTDVHVTEGRLGGRSGACLVSTAPSVAASPTYACSTAFAGAIKILATATRIYVLKPGRLQIFTAP